MNPAFYRRFGAYQFQLGEILDKCKESHAPGLMFYREGARNVLFRLEALTRMYRKIAGSKKLDKWYKTFKDIEDFLGSIDYFDAMSSEFSRFPETRDMARKYFHVRFSEETAFLGEYLREKGWLDGSRLKEFDEDLEALPRISAEEDLNEVARLMAKELNQLEEEYGEGEFDMWKLEAGLHEFRRKIRWVSIYAGALNGAFQLKQVSLKDESLKDYLQPSVLEASYNRFPEPESDYRPIWVQSTWFYALSSVIGHLGELKDTGQRYHACVEMMDRHQADPEATKRFLDNYRSQLSYRPDEIPVLAEQAIDRFFYRDRIAQRLVRDLKREF